MASVKSITLVNGLKVVHVPHKVGSITACLRGLAGSNYEKVDEVGAAHVLEHLCTFATADYDSPKKLRDLILSRGGRVTGTTSRDDVAFFAKVLKKDLPYTIEYLYQIFHQSLLTRKNLESTKNIIRHEIYQNIEDPKKHIGRISYKILYPRQRLATYNTGSIDDLNCLTLKKIKEFRDRLHFPGNFVLSVCGDFPTKTLFNLTDKYFGHISDHKKNPPLNLEPNYKRSFLVENRNNLAHMHLKIDYHGFKTSEKMKYAAYLAAIILKQRLNQAIFSEQRFFNSAPYILDAASFNTNSYGLFGIYTAIQPKRLREFLLLYYKVIEKLLQNGLTSSELVFAKNKAQADLEFSLEKTSLRADFYSELFLYKNVAHDHKAEIQNYLNCTKKNVLGAIRDVLSQEPKITVIDKNIQKGELIKIYSGVFD